MTGSAFVAKVRKKEGVTGRAAWRLVVLDAIVAYALFRKRDQKTQMIARPALHASELTIKHPTTKEPVTISAPLPHEFEVALKYLCKFGTAARVIGSKR